MTSKKWWISLLFCSNLLKNVDKLCLQVLVKAGFGLVLLGCPVTLVCPQISQGTEGLAQGAPRNPRVTEVC